MDIKLIALILSIGIVIGMVISAKLKIGSTEITNEIRKVKGNGGIVDISQSMPSEIKTEPKKGLFKRIFPRKNK